MIMRYDVLGKVDMRGVAGEARKVADRMSLIFEESAGRYHIKDTAGTRTLASLGPEGFNMDTVKGYESLRLSLETVYIRAMINRKSS